PSAPKPAPSSTSARSPATSPGQTRRRTFSSSSRTTSRAAPASSRSPRTRSSRRSPSAGDSRRAVLAPCRRLGAPALLPAPPRSRMSVVFRQVLFGLGVVLLQWLVFGRLKLWGAYPDIVLLFVAWIGLRFGRVGGSVAGFLTGFL